VYSKQETAINCFATANKPSSVILLNSDQGLASHPTSPWRLKSLVPLISKVPDYNLGPETGYPSWRSCDSSQSIQTDRQTPVMISNHTTAAVFSVTPTKNQTFFSFLRNSHFHSCSVLPGAETSYGSKFGIRFPAGPKFLPYYVQTNSESPHLLALQEGCFAGLKLP